MTERRYGQYCGFARALELVGERWALLIVRDLLVERKRFTDLQRGLPGIPTNILTARLKELERAGVVRRLALPPPERSVVYELTAYGQELEEAVVAFSRWGAKSLGAPGADEVVTPDSLLMALRTTFRPDAARGIHAGVELRSRDIVINARIDDGMLRVARGPLAEPDLVIEGGPLRPLMAGEVSAREAIAHGGVRIRGDRRLFARFADIFHIDPKPPERL